MNPQGQNPFQHIVNSFHQHAQATRQGGQPQGQMPSVVGLAQSLASQPTAQTAPAGQGPDQPQGSTKLLLTAAQALHNAIPTLADPQEAAIIRSMIILLNQLIQKDQVAQAGQPAGQPGGAPQNAAAQAQQQAQAMPQGPIGQ